MIESFKLPVIIPETVSGSICSFNDEYGNLPLKSCVSQISGYQEGSGTPSPSNVRPLHAWSSANLTATGKNLFDILTLIPHTYIDNNGDEKSYSGSASTSPYIFLHAGNYIISRKSTSTAIWKIYKYSKSKAKIGFIFNNKTTQSEQFTVEDCYIRISFDFIATSSDEIQLELGQQATAYEPFGNSYTFTFGQDIYQGSIDWKRGVVTATWGYIASYNGETLTGEWLCDKAPYEAGTTPSTGSQVALELATPIEIPLGGIIFLTREGVNNIYCDTGDTTVEWLKVN